MKTEMNNDISTDMVNGKPTPSFLSRLGRAFLKLLRILLILALIAGVVAAFYYGVPYFYQKVILPIENNTARLSEIEKAQSTGVEQLTSQITNLQSRLSALETRQTINAQAITELTGQVLALETAVATHTKSLEQLDVMQIQLETLTGSVEGHNSLLTGENSVLADLRHEIILSRGIELLSRARLYLSQSNYGMAKQDVIAARDLLKSLQEENLAEESSTLQSVLTQLDLALDNLPSFPVVAVDNVDIAWQLLVNSWSEQMRTVPTIESNTLMPTPNGEMTPTAAP